MIKTELDALAIITEIVHTHQKCPDVQKKMNKEILKAKKEAKSMYELQLQRNADLADQIDTFNEVNRGLGELNVEMQNAKDFVERLAFVEKDSQLQEDTLENSNVSHKEEIDELKKMNERLLEDVVALRKDNEDLMKTNQQLTDDFGKLKKENVETKEMLQNILQDFERVHRRLREIDTKMTSSGE